MKMELNRRTFLVVLGAASVASAIRPKNPAPTPAAMRPNGIYFFSKVGNKPAGRPRTAAITYLPLDGTVELEF